MMMTTEAVGGLGRGGWGADVVIESRRRFAQLQLLSPPPRNGVALSTWNDHRGAPAPGGAPHNLHTNRVVRGQAHSSIEPEGHSEGRASRNLTCG